MFSLDTGAALKIYPSAVRTKCDGFVPACVRACLEGKQMRHKGYGWRSTLVEVESEAGSESEAASQLESDETIEEQVTDSEGDESSGVYSTDEEELSESESGESEESGSSEDCEPIPVSALRFSDSALSWKGRGEAAHGLAAAPRKKDSNCATRLLREQVDRRVALVVVKGCPPSKSYVPRDVDVAVAASRADLEYSLVRAGPRSRDPDALKISVASRGSAPNLPKPSPLDWYYIMAGIRGSSSRKSASSVVNVPSFRESRRITYGNGERYSRPKGFISPPSRPAKDAPSEYDMDEEDEKFLARIQGKGKESSASLSRDTFERMVEYLENVYHAEEASRAAQSKMNEFQVRSRKTNEAAERLLSIVDNNARVPGSTRPAARASQKASGGRQRVRRDNVNKVRVLIPFGRVKSMLMQCGGWVGRNASYGVGEYFSDKVYEYWAAKRSRRSGPLLRTFKVMSTFGANQPAQPSVDALRPSSTVGVRLLSAFTSNSSGGTSNNDKRLLSALQYLKSIRRDLERARVVVDLIHKREKMKRKRAEAVLNEAVCVSRGIIPVPAKSFALFAPAPSKSKVDRFLFRPQGSRTSPRVQEQQQQQGSASASPVPPRPVPASTPSSAASSVPGKPLTPSITLEEQMQIALAMSMSLDNGASLGAGASHQSKRRRRTR